MGKYVVTAKVFEKFWEYKCIPFLELSLYMYVYIYIYTVFPPLYTLETFKIDLEGMVLI